MHFMRNEWLAVAAAAVAALSTCAHAQYDAPQTSGRYKEVKSNNALEVLLHNCTQSNCLTAHEKVNSLAAEEHQQQHLKPLRHDALALPMLPNNGPWLRF